MTLDATVGGPASNAYLTVAEATAFLDERLNTQPWYVQPQDVTLQAQREAALITATRLLDEQVRWVGTPSSSTQALGWPRSGLSFSLGQAIPPDVIPLTIQRATAYYALHLLRDTSEVTTTTTTGSGVVKRRSLGETTVEYFQPGTTTTGQTAPRPPGTTLPAEIRQMLRGYGLLVGGVVVPLVRT
jgi:hypothetical protein